MMLNVTLYTRENCSLCDEVKEYLKALQGQYPHRLAVVDIASDAALQERYGEQVPIVEVGPYKLRAPITRESLAVTLGAARDRRGQLEQAGGTEYLERVRKGQAVTGSDRVYFWVAKHYLALLNLVVCVYVGLPFLAPVLMETNVPAAANVLYKMYSPLCHQFGFRSFFLFGEQPYYPLKAAGVSDVKTFEQVTGYTDVANPYSMSRVSARAYIGNAAIGYKVALCERDVAIYAAIVVFGLIYGLIGRRLPGLHWLLWILIGLGPIGLDGFSQLFSQFNWPWLAHILPYRESTPMLRVLTGFLFGFTTAWFAVPNIEESMKETRQFLVKKFAVAQS
jgi:uncharacterized membrane protein